MEDAAPLVVLTTLSDTAQADRLITSLVEQRVAACGTILEGAHSIYRWKGSIEREKEVLVILKTMAHRWHDLRDAVHRDHPYETPELLALPVAHGAEAYVQWLAAETGSDTER